MITTRFAPSPTGKFHMGSLRTAIYNYLFSKKYKGRFILRIEDTDKERSKKEYEDEILKIFNVFKLDFDELNRQSSNNENHKRYLEDLLVKGFAYKEENGPYRFKVNRDKDHFEYDDVILGKVKIPSKNIEDFSIARSDKNPTFILSNLVDDIEDNVTHIIRGNDHSINTIKQILILNSLGLNIIKYAHIPLIHDIDGKKLSKRNNITNVEDYLEEGYLPESIFNFIIKLGNNFNDKEYLGLNEALENFELSKTVLSPAKFDLEKLNFINQYYLKEISFTSFQENINKNNKILLEKFNIKLIYKDILDRCIKLTDINLELEKLMKFYNSKIKLEVNEEEESLIKNIYQVIQNLHENDDVIKELEKNDLFLKKIGKIIRKIMVNFESKLPIEKIILFYGIGNFKERLLLYIK
ncbi:MAG: glutamate--tRNA ligase [Alphaproteobacteria bacterium]